ncbi:dephospho-CoA kinase [Helcococcus kunzii]|uniref:Dephospho-CoA kinase n=1 Tax=Helcococcus kunzii ATCC 51366 TaxID=883114 RepID=H3NMM5_9FIRM|nr:dephospho-CoA kinase [Helcococcus kunzii]EHR34844.1 dephospho-CoA kinase [Helcococcus kunzii ATCC 51366]QUY64532.1 dephospho-CoA kinase [Helcococcus kunzii]QZO76945.1 dephospho-CoA kinase [Helcococcus kunzii]
MKSRVVGITGSIATGKSTVTDILKDLGYNVIDADKIAHQLMKVGNENYDAIVSYFGDKILNPDKSINRKKLGNIVFNDKKQLNKLNNLTHDNIFNKIKENIEFYKNEIIFVDIPLLIELKIKGALSIEFDEIWLVYVDRQIQIERLAKRNNISYDEAEKLVNTQINIDDKVQYCDFILDNSKDIDYVKKQIIEKMRTL